MVRLPNESVRQYGKRRLARTAVAALLCDAQLELLMTRASRRPDGDDYRCVLTAHRRRMLEDARAEKRRFDPLVSQRRNYGKVNGRSRYTDQWRMSSMIVVAGGDHCHPAIVFDTIRVLVDALV
jgi:hypothetical protein